MIDNILGYVLTADNYYKLWLVSDGTSHGIRYPKITCTLSQQFHDVRDVPTTIEVVDDYPLLDGEGRFHTGNNSPTAKLKRMTLRWGQHNMFPCRHSGNPCEIVFENLRMWHHQDVLHRNRGNAIILQNVTLRWNTRNHPSWYRGSGPYSVTLKEVNVKCVSDENLLYSNVRDINVQSVSCSWYGHGRRLGENRVKKVITDNQISVNYFLAGNSIFQNEGEEFIFWSEIGGNL